MKAPNSYFTTAFSGSVRVQRARLKNLFAKDRRPGVLPLTIVVLCAALLGGLVSCQPTVSDEPKVPTAIPTAIVWGEQVQSTVLTAENMADPNVEVPDGVAVRLRFTMPYIENAAGHEALEALNRDFLSQGHAWLEKGREYWGTPGLVPGGDYSVEGTHTVTRCDDLISVRYDRVERLPYPTATRTAVTYSLAGGTARELRLDDLFDGDAEDWTPILLDEAVRANADFDRDYYESYFDVNAFYLTGDLLVLLFPVWEDGAPIPCSTAECSIPLTSLADISSELLRPRALITPAPPVATGTPAFSIAVPDALLDNVPPVALRAAQEQCLPGGAYYESFAASTDRRASPIFDRAELLFLREDWTYDRLDAVPNTDPPPLKSIPSAPGSTPPPRTG